MRTARHLSPSSPHAPAAVVRVCVGTAVALGLALSACGANAISSQAGPVIQASPVTVVIAAVELQFEDPSPGGQSVWLANRGTNEQDISCWSITAASSRVIAYVDNGTRLAPGRAVRFTAPPRMLGSRDTITLRDRTGQVIDSTPELTDSAGDDQLWYVLRGGMWTFGRTRLPEPVSDGRLVPAC
jgi:hypothetical protein